MIRRWLLILLIADHGFFFRFFLSSPLFFLFVTVIKCPSLDTPDDAVKTGQECNAPTASYGTTCFFGCNLGYESVNGSTQRTCQANQQWSGIPFLCQGKDNNWLVEIFTELSVWPGIYSVKANASVILVFSQTMKLMRTTNFNNDNNNNNRHHNCYRYRPRTRAKSVKWIKLDPTRRTYHPKWLQVRRKNAAYSNIKQRQNYKNKTLTEGVWINHTLRHEFLRVKRWKKLEKNSVVTDIIMCFSRDMPCYNHKTRRTYHYPTSLLKLKCCLRLCNRVSFHL